MPVTINHALTATTPDDPAYEIRPIAHWNATHAAILSAVGSEIVGAFSNSNGISFGLEAGGAVTGSYTVPSVTQFLTTAMASNRGSDFVQATAAFAGTSASGTIGSAGISVSIGPYITTAMLSNAATISNIRVSAGTTSNLLSALTFSNANGITFGLDASTVTASHNGLTSQSNQNVTAGNGGFAFQTLSFSNANGMSFGTSAGSAITGSYTVPTVTNSSWSVSDAATSGTVARLAFTNLNGVTLSLSSGAGGSHTIVGSHNALTSQSNQAFTAAGGSSAFQTLAFGDTNSVSFTNTNGSVGIASIKLQMFAVSNTTQSSSGTANHTALSFGGAGVASVGVTGGSVVISVPAGAPSPVNFSAGTTSSDLGSVVFSNSNGVSFGLNGSTITASVNAAGGGATISSYENMPLWGTSAVTFGVTSLSSAVAFLMPQAGSFSFLRIPVLMTMGSTTIATIASATASAQMGQSSTFNAVVYSVGVGASSKSLISVASGSGSVNLSGRISITNSTQGSYTLAYSGLVEGGGTTRTTQYSVSNTNYSFTSQAMSEFSSNRFLDIPFANSLAAGAYWLVVGRSTSSSSAGAALSAITSWGPRYSNHYAGTQGNLLFGVMGSTNQTSIGALIGAGVFSTAGGGTTSRFPISAISSTASNPRMYFQLLRSA